jgi:hypothetical protein
MPIVIMQTMEYGNANTKILKDAQLSANDMAFYLRRHGWQERPGENTRITFFNSFACAFGDRRNVH